MKIIIVGAGEVGYHVASRMSFENKDVVVIDRDPVAIQRISDNVDVESINGSGSSPRVLKEAGLKEAEILLAVTDSDETNLVACLMADVISPTTKKLARIREGDFDPYHQVLHDQAPHIDTVINPEIEVVKSIERFLSIPGAVDVSEFADGMLKFIGLYLDQGSLMAGIRLREIPEKIGQQILVAAVVRKEELIIPGGDARLYPGDLVYFISEEKGVAPILKAFNRETKPVRRAMIVGGGRIGARLAGVLEKKGIQIKIIERLPARCSELAAEMKKAVVIHGDGSDQGLLVEENIREMDAVVTLTNDEETNILVSLLARRMGAGKSITKLNKFSYFPLMPTIGIEQVVSPRLSAINTILQHIRRGKVFSVRTLTDEQAEVMEAEALETSDIVGRPLRKSSLPKGSLVIGIIREGQVLIPSGDSVIEPGDRIIIFAKRQVVSKIERILTVKLEFF
ncbi:MAG: Trk system potassium transporter TrkA [Desulfobacteraceae bacterium]|nr:Trk system potassium transporter TrkA [Desulfobacteraceae bacterium]